MTSLVMEANLKVSSIVRGCLVQVGNGIELEAVGLQFEPYLWRPCGVTWDSSRTVVVIKLRRTSALMLNHELSGHAHYSKIASSRSRSRCGWIVCQEVHIRPHSDSESPTVLPPSVTCQPEPRRSAWPCQWTRSQSWTRSASSSCRGRVTPRSGGFRATRRAGPEHERETLRRGLGACSKRLGWLWLRYHLHNLPTGWLLRDSLRALFHMSPASASCVVRRRRRSRSIQNCCS